MKPGEAGLNGCGSSWGRGDKSGESTGCLSRDPGKNPRRAGSGATGFPLTGCSAGRGEQAAGEERRPGQRAALSGWSSVEFPVSDHSRI